MKMKTCGSEESCDIVLASTVISPLHARIELSDDGLVSVLDDDSKEGTFLNRNGDWIRVRKVTLCIGDRIRFGDVEVSLDRLVAVFGNDSNARLEARHFALRQLSNNTKAFVKHHEHGPALQKPRRNPTTGKIEEDSPKRTI
jgi:pSer/pThr/pTyr-binding forkhead associated (FHA) protein